MVENNGTNGTPTTSEPVPAQVPGQAPYQQYPANPQQPPTQGYPPQQPYQQPPVQNYGYPQQAQQPQGQGYGYPQQPAMQGYAQPQATDQKQTRKVVRILYGVITLGLLLAAGPGVFLPWANMQVFYQDVTYHASMNGLGQFNGDPLFVTALQQNAPIAVKDGVFVLFLAILIALFTIGGFLKQSSWFAMGILVCGTFCTYMFATDLLDANNKLAGTATATASSTVGIGMPLGLVGSIVIVGASIAALVYSRRLKKSTVAFK